jgi:hypothetical protein
VIASEASAIERETASLPFGASDSIPMTTGYVAAGLMCGIGTEAARGPLATDDYAGGRTDLSYS